MRLFIFVLLFTFSSFSSAIYVDSTSAYNACYGVRSSCSSQGSVNGVGKYRTYDADRVDYIYFYYYTPSGCKAGDASTADGRCETDSDGDGTPDEEEEPDDGTKWCDSLGGEISENMDCPDSPYDCPGGCFGADEAGKEGSKAGAEAGKNTQMNDPDNGGSSSPAGSSSEAKKAGGGSGAKAGAKGAMDAGAGSGDGGLSQDDKSALADAAGRAADMDNTSKAAVQSEVYSTCTDRGLTPQQCMEVAIAAGAGFESGEEAAVIAYEAAKNGPADQGSAAICNGPDCADLWIDPNDPSVDSLAFVRCLTGMMPNPSGGSPACVNNPNADPWALPCYPTVANNFCSGYKTNADRLCPGGIWDGDYCEYPVKTTSCPGGTKRGADGVCRKTSSSSGSGSVQCPSGSTHNGVYCARDQTSSTNNSSSTSTTSTNSDGSTTTTTTTNIYNVGSGEGEGEGSGPCDPEQPNYLNCVMSGGTAFVKTEVAGFSGKAQIEYDAAKLEYEQKFNQIMGELSEAFSLNIGGGGGGSIPSFMQNVRGVDVEFGPLKWQEHLSIVAAIMWAGFVLGAAIIVLGGGKK